MKLSELRRRMRFRACARCGAFCISHDAPLSVKVCKRCCRALKEAPIGTEFHDGKQIIDVEGIAVTEEAKQLGMFRATKT
jgi:hypothetical protein